MLSINKRKLIQSLGRKKVRDEEKLFVAEGAKIVSDLIAAGVVPTLIVAAENAVDVDYAAETIVASEAEMKSISQMKTPPKMLGVFRKPTTKSLIENAPADIVLVLDEIQDPGNLGTIIRTADWFGIRRIACSDTCADAYSPKTIQATMGAIARVSVEEFDLEKLLQKNASAWRLPVYGTFLDGDNIYTSELASPSLIIMGNEGKGIGPKVEKYINRKLLIPSYPAGARTSESLNVAMATAVVCSEFRRRKI